MEEAATYYSRSSRSLKRFFSLQEEKKKNEQTLWDRAVSSPPAHPPSVCQSEHTSDGPALHLHDITVDDVRAGGCFLCVFTCQRRWPAPGGHSPTPLSAEWRRRRAAPEEEHRGLPVRCLLRSRVMTQTPVVQWCHHVVVTDWHWNSEWGSSHEAAVLIFPTVSEHHSRDRMFSLSRSHNAPCSLQHHTQETNSINWDVCRLHWSPTMHCTGSNNHFLFDRIQVS